MAGFLLCWFSVALAATALWCVASARLTGSAVNRRVSLKAAWGFLAGALTMAAIAVLAI
jgi:hypothetical protein